MSFLMFNYILTKWHPICRAQVCVNLQHSLVRVYLQHSFLQANIGELCYYTDQCLGNAECKLNRCTCPPRTVSSNGTCVINTNCASYQILAGALCLDTVSIGMVCEDNSQCIGKDNLHMYLWWKIISGLLIEGFVVLTKQNVRYFSNAFFSVLFTTTIN